MLNSHVIDRWYEHPIVRHAHRGLEEGDLVGLFHNLHDTLLELEERFPGVPFDTILHARATPAPEELRRQLLDAGADRDDVVLVLGPELRPGAWANDEWIYPSLLADMRSRDMVAAGLVESKKRGDIYRAFRMPLTELDLRIGDLHEQGMSLRGIAAEVGKSKVHVGRVLRKIAYHQWLAERAVSA